MCPTEIQGEYSGIIRVSPCTPWLRGFSKSWFFCKVVVFLSMVTAGCSFPESNAGGARETEFSLMERFVRSGEDSAGALHRNMQVTRRGRRESSIVLVAPVAVVADIGEDRGTVKLEFLAAPVFNLGDGFQLNVFLKDAHRTAPVYSRYFDAGRKASDRDWIPIEISLDLVGQRSRMLELKVSGGPQGDLVGDWLALAQMRVLHPGYSTR